MDPSEPRKNKIEKALEATSSRYNMLHCNMGGKLTLWDFGLPPCPQLSKTFKIFQKCSFLLEIQIPINVMKKRSAINSKGSDWYCCANYNTVDPDSSLTMVHEDMNFLVKYKIRDEFNSIIDTVTSINKENGSMIYLVNYMINGYLISPLTLRPS